MSGVALTKTARPLSASVDSQPPLFRQREQAANAALEELQGQRDNLHELLLEKTELVERVMKVFPKAGSATMVAEEPMLFFTLQLLATFTTQKSGEASHSDSGLWSSLGAAGNLQQDRAVFLQVGT